MSLEKTITLETLAESFGTTVDDLNEDTVKLFKKMNTNYRIIDNKYRL